MTGKRWCIKVRVRDPATGRTHVELGRPGPAFGGQPYSYVSKGQAEDAARLWGDAWMRGDVWVEEEEEGK